VADVFWLLDNLYWKNVENTKFAAKVNYSVHKAMLPTLAH